MKHWQRVKIYESQVSVIVKVEFLSRHLFQINEAAVFRLPINFRYNWSRISFASPADQSFTTTTISARNVTEIALLHSRMLITHKYFPETQVELDHRILAEIISLQLKHWYKTQIAFAILGIIEKWNYFIRRLNINIFCWAVFKLKLQMINLCLRIKHYNIIVNKMKTGVSRWLFC